MAGLAHPVLLSTFCNMDTITIAGKTMEFDHVFYTWIVMAILFTLAFLCKRKLTMVPGGLQNFWEAIVDTIDKFVCGSMGEKVGSRFVPFLCGLFVFILFSNFMGLIPGFNAPTANLNTTVCMALFVFILYNVVGILVWHHKYIKQFLGISKWLIPGNRVPPLPPALSLSPSFRQHPRRRNRAHSVLHYGTYPGHHPDLLPVPDCQVHAGPGVLPPCHVLHQQCYRGHRTRVRSLLCGEWSTVIDPTI